MEKGKSFPLSPSPLRAAQPARRPSSPPLLALGRLGGLAPPRTPCARRLEPLPASSCGPRPSAAPPPKPLSLSPRAPSRTSPPHDLSLAPVPPTPYAVSPSPLLLCSLPFSDRHPRRARSRARRGLSVPPTPARARPRPARSILGPGAPARHGGAPARPRPARSIPDPGAPARHGGAPARPPPAARLSPTRSVPGSAPARPRRGPARLGRGTQPSAPGAATPIPGPAPVRPHARPRAPCSPSSRPWVPAWLSASPAWRGRPPAQPRCLRSAFGPGAAPLPARGACAALCSRVLAWCAQCFSAARRALNATRSILSRVTCPSTPSHPYTPRVFYAH
jgi:hypothetical protein